MLRAWSNCAHFRPARRVASCDARATRPARSATSSAPRSGNPRLLRSPSSPHFLPPIAQIMKPKLTFEMTVCPPCCLTKSLTGPDGAFSRVLPPVIAEGHALFRRGEHSQRRTDELGDS